jgi:hypothetical protein
MGGASEQEDAMIWFLNRADGGDVVVLRASGSDGYNDYFYSELAADLDEPINSVTTFVINNVNGAIDPFVLQKVPGNESGVNYFDLSDWETGSGGEWRDWSIDNGVFTSVVGVNPHCALLSISEVSLAQISVYPNPFVDTIKIESETEIESIQLIDILGKTIPVELQSDMTVIMSSLKCRRLFFKVEECCC